MTVRAILGSRAVLGSVRNEVGLKSCTEVYYPSDCLRLARICLVQLAEIDKDFQATVFSGVTRLGFLRLPEIHINLKPLFVPH